jgi:hypothetical protein
LVTSLADVVVVTGEDVAADRDFQAAVAGLALPSLYLATVNREGRFRLIAKPPRAGKVVREATFKLDELLAPPRRRAAPLVDRRLVEDLPAICVVRPFPLRLPHKIDPHRMWPIAGRGVLAFTTDRRLMFWDRKECGARQLADDLPTAGTIHWRGLDSASGVARMVVGNLHERGLYLVRADLESGESQTAPLEIAGHPRAVFQHGGVFFALRGEEMDVLDMAARRIQTADCFDLKWVRGRFFKDPKTHAWYVLSYNGHSLEVEQVWKTYTEASSIKDPINDAFEWIGHGPVGFIHYYGGSTRCIMPDESLKTVSHGLPAPKLLAVAHDGSACVLGQGGFQSGQVGRLVRIDVATGNFTSHQMLRDQAQLLADDPGFGQAMAPRPLRARFLGVVADPLKNSLALVSSTKNYWRIEYQPKQKRMALVHESKWSNAFSERRDFEKAITPVGVGYSLRVAAWPDGSRAWIDSRSLLHLHSSDPNIPELTLVLGESELAGWCSDGRMWGPSYFTGDGTNASAEEIFREVLTPFVARLA